MVDDEYDLMPHEEILKLKEEIKSLKGGKKGGDLQSSVEGLKESIDKLLSIFRQAAKEMGEEGASSFSKKLDEVLDRLDEISDENEKIANGILAVVDMIKEPEIPTIAPPPREPPRPMPPRMPLGPEGFPPMGPRMPRPPEDVMLGPPGGMPPPPPMGGSLPPLPPKRKGFLR